MIKLLLLGGLGYAAYQAFQGGISAGGRTLAVVFQDQTFQPFNSITPQLETAIRTGGSRTVIMDGGQIVHTFQVKDFMGGILLDNCPINAVLGQGWLPGQNDALVNANLQPFCKVVR